MVGTGQSGTSSSYASTSTDRSLTYDVFLSFRGEDTRRGFTGHLYSALNRERINVFMDSHKLWEGEEIGPKLMEAIQGSKISIPIFSKGYADSKWCLMELEKILECHKSNHQIVLPIFFDVEPSDVRHQSGRSFEKAFLKHERNFQPQIVKCWREALSEIGKMKGWVLNQIDINGDESTLIQRVVERILGETSSIYLSDVKYAVGLDSHVNAIRSLLNIGSKDVLIIGICGEGGIGKTTAAKALYNLFVKSFHQNCFLQNIREEASRGSNGLVSLQEKLICSITKRKVNGEIWLVDRGKEEIRNRCQGVNVLLVLDDVDDRSQLDALAIDLKWLGQGSRVIITTRDEHVLNVAKVDPSNIYRPKELDFDQSLRLFRLHAFEQNEPFEEYKELSRDVARYSGGLPLTLEVLGSYLSDIRNKEEWENALQKLRASPHKEVYKKLKISYDSLEDGDQKAIFLDAACFLVGWNKRDVISLWEACGFYPKLAIKRLVQRSLLKFTAKGDSQEYLEMHDQIRDMGRQIVLEESCGILGRRSRLWTRKEIVEVLEGHKGTEYIEGINLPGQLIDLQFPSFCLPIECLEKMSNLRFLDIKHALSKGDDFPHLPCGLRWFSWTGCPIKVLPDNFYHKFQNLKVLKLGNCPISIFPDFSWFPSLEQLDLRDCKKLVHIDESIGQLSHLKILILACCDSLKKLPDSICRLSSLQRLDLEMCHSLNRLPESIGDLKSLLELPLEETRIKELPDSICKLSSLQKLGLTGCLSFNRLPESIGDLKSLLELYLARTNIEELPDSICRLSSLQKLELEMCDSLNRLPESIGDLKSLLELDLMGTQIEELPDSICKLSSLQKLGLRGCQSLNRLPESIGDLKSLLELDLAEITYIEELPDSICRLSSLQRLDLGICKSLDRLPESIGDLKSLLELDLWETQIEELPDSICRLSSLQSLYLGMCQSLNRLPESIGDLKSLLNLNFESTEIEELPDSICRLSSLQSLDLNWCQSLYRLPESIGDLKSLVILKLDNTQIGELPKSVDLLEKLEILSVLHCKNTVKLPRSMGTELATDFPKLSSLVELGMTCEFNVVEIRFSGFSQLKRLSLIDCTTLEDLTADLSDLKNLQKLVLSKLKKLRYLLELPSSLISLDCLACTSLECLPDLSSLKSLSKLHLTDCSRLEKIGGLGGLKSLEKFYVMGCHYKALQGRPLLVDGADSDGLYYPFFHSKEYSFLNAYDGIHKQLFLIIVFAFNSLVKEKVEEGELVDIELIISANIFDGYRKSLMCGHSIFIENVEFTTERDIIYIHNLQGFTWFGLPLGGKDVMSEIRVTRSSLYKLSDSGVYHRISGWDNYVVILKSWSLEYINEESGKALPNQEWGDKNIIIDMLSGLWPHADADAGAGSDRVFVSQSAFTKEGPFRTEYIVSNYGNVRPCLRDTKERIYFVLEGPHEEDNNASTEKDPPLICSRKKRRSVTSCGIGSVGPGDDTADVAEETPEASSTNRRSTRMKRRPSTLSDYV